MVDDPTAILAKHLAVGFEGGPVWASARVTTISGRVVTNKVRAVPLRRYSFTGAVNKIEHLHELLEHFNGREGGSRSFPLLDWTDNKTTNEQFGTGDGTTTTFTLSKTYGAYRRTIVLPELTTTTVTVAGAANTDWTFANGEITFDTAPADGAALRWSGTFYTPVRYAQDELFIRLTVAGGHIGETSQLDCYEVAV